MSDGINGSRIPLILDALFAAAQAYPGLTGVNVTDSVPETLNSGDYVAIGVDDWELDKPADSANSTMTWSDTMAGGNSDEAGAITIVAWSNAGGTGQVKVVRDKVFAIHSAFKALIIAALAAAQSDALGVPGLWDIRVGGVDGFNQASNANGATAVLRFSIPFRAVI